MTLKNSPPSYRPFPVQVLPEPIQGFLCSTAKAIGCDVSFLALPLLTVLGAAIGNSRRLKLKQGWNVPPIIWTAIVGDSGTSKTPAFRQVMNPLKALAEKASEVHEQAMQEYQRQYVQYEKEFQHWKRDKKSKNGPPSEPVEPQEKRYFVSDVTMEALAPLLKANPRGLLLACDELSGWFGSFDRYANGKGGADAAHWLSTFNAESIQVDRKTGNRPALYVPEAAISVTGGIQPAILHRALGHEHRESGLAARLLLCYPPRKSKKWTDSEIDPKLESELAELIRKLYDLRPIQYEEDKSRPALVRLEPDAKEVWKRFYNEHAQEQADLTGDLAAAWSKLEEYAARLALVIHFVRYAANDVSLASEDELDSASLNAGIELVHWFKNETKRVYQRLSAPDEEKELEQIMELIERKGGRSQPDNYSRVADAIRPQSKPKAC